MLSTSDGTTSPVKKVFMRLDVRETAFRGVRVVQLDTINDAKYSRGSKKHCGPLVEHMNLKEIRRRNTGRTKCL